MKAMVAVAALLAASACSAVGGGPSPVPSSGPTGSPLAQASGKLDAQVTMPAGFPNDVPIYPGARLTAGASFTSSSVITWGMEWETLDSIDKVRAFYARQLAQGDWTVNVTGGSGATFSAVFARKSNQRFGGVLGADASSGVTKISMSLLSQG